MKVIQLRHSLQLSPNHASVDFLAYIASDPRNWLVCQLEPNVQRPGDNLRVIDIWPTPDQYPTADLDLYFVVVCLDGAVDRARCGENMEVAERFFLELINRATEVSKGNVPDVSFQTSYRDGKLLAYENPQSAVNMLKSLATQCQAINDSTRMPWNKEYHVRAGVGSSVRGAFTALLNARRDEVGLILHSGMSVVWSFV